MTWTETPDFNNEGLAVVAPSGAKFYVVSTSEATYFNDIAARYMADNKFGNITDLQDLDRLLVMEVMCWRWGLWLSQERDYEGESVDLEALKKALNEYGKEVRLLKKAMGIDKAARDREKGSNVADYLENVRMRAKEFGVMREDQLTKALTLFHELKAQIIFMDNCTPGERRENDIEPDDIFNWLRQVAFPEFDLIDQHFRKNAQKYWIKDV